MAKRRGAQREQHRKKARWVAWELIRLSKEYKADVHELVKRWTRLKVKPRYSTKPLLFRKLSAARHAFDAYVSLQAEAARLAVICDHVGAAKDVPVIFINTANSTSRQYEDRDQWLRNERSRLVHIFGSGLGCRWGFPEISEWGKSENIDLLPELQAFEARWGLKFPLPPELEIPDDMDLDVVTVPMVRPVKTIELDATRVTLAVWPAVAARTLVLEALEFELDQASPIKPGTRKRSGVGGLPHVTKRPDGSLLISVNLPCDPRRVRTAVAPHVRDADHRFREIHRAIGIARLLDQGRSEEEVADLIITESVAGARTDSQPAARRRRVRTLHRTFLKLQNSLLRIASTAYPTTSVKSTPPQN